MSDKVDLRFLLLFDLKPETMLARLSYRASVAKVKRADDKLEVMKKRIKLFEASRPIFNVFKESGKLRSVDAEGSKEEVTKVLDELFKTESLAAVKGKLKEKFGKKVARIFKFGNGVERSARSERRSEMKLARTLKR